MVPEVEKIHFLDLNVQVAKPLINVPHVLLLDVLELVGAPVNITIEQRQLELSCVDLELSVDNRECTPSNNYILKGVLRAQINKLKNDHIGWQ